MAINLLYAGPPLPVLGQRDVVITTKKEVEVWGHRTIRVHSSIILKSLRKLKITVICSIFIFQRAVKA